MAVGISMWSQVVRHWLWFSSPVICQFNWFSSCIQLFPSNQILVTVVPPADPPVRLKHQSIYPQANCLCTWRLWTFPDNTRQWCPVWPSFQVILEPGRGWNATYLLSPSWIHVFGILALHFNTLLTFYVACRS
jgi:hypothetical protein